MHLKAFAKPLAGNHTRFQVPRDILVSFEMSILQNLLFPSFLTIIQSDFSAQQKNIEIQG